MVDFLGMPHLVKGNADILNSPLTAGRIAEFAGVLDVGVIDFVELLQRYLLSEVNIVS